jgi:hypothetical protein
MMNYDDFFKTYIEWTIHLYFISTLFLAIFFPHDSCRCLLFIINLIFYIANGAHLSPSIQELAVLKTTQN